MERGEAAEGMSHHWITPSQEQLLGHRFTIKWKVWRVQTTQCNCWAGRVKQCRTGFLGKRRVQDKLTAVVEHSSKAFLLQQILAMPKSSSSYTSSWQSSRVQEPVTLAFSSSHEYSFQYAIIAPVIALYLQSCSSGRATDFSQGIGWLWGTKAVVLNMTC